MLFGDLNEVVNANEKLGGKSIWNKKLYLKRFMQELGAINLGFCGRRFMWENGQEGKAAIKKRIDRAVANRD